MSSSSFRVNFGALRIRVALVGSAFAWGALAMAAAVRADVNYPNFTNDAGLTYNGDASQAGSVLRLTPDLQDRLGSVWYSAAKQHLAGGFETSFGIRMGGAMSGDGMAFVIQDDSTAALGGGGSDLGYSGIFRSLAIEFDTFGFYPETDNHISVQTRGVDDNSSQDDFALAQANVQRNLNDGNIVNVLIRYRPGALLVFLDGSDAPVIDVAVDLASINGNSILDGSGDAWVGFTGATGGATETHDVEYWSLSEDDSALPTGPCCTLSGCVIANQHECAAVYGGFFSGPVNGNCDNTVCEGACCTGDFCDDFVSLNDCVNQGGHFRGVGVQCDSPDFPTCTGACCDGDGQCYVGYQSDCENGGGVFHGPGTACWPFPCALPLTGACCDGFACSLETEQDCVNLAGDWYGRGTQCDDVDCFGGPPPLGACCQPGSTCVDRVQQSACEHFNGTYNGDDSLCSESNCVSAGVCDCVNAIPIGDSTFFSDSTTGEPVCSVAICNGVSDNSPSKIYAITPSVGGLGLINTCNNASFPTTVALYSDCPMTEGNLIACEHGTCGNGAQIQFCAEAGATYYLRIGGENGASGDFDLLAIVLTANLVEGPIQNPANGHWYYSTSQAPWEAGEALAVSKGGHMVTINDAAENDWINQNFNQFGLFIGFNDVASEGNFVWTSGEPVTFTNWDAGEPSNGGGVEDYALMEFSGLWLDQDACSGGNGLPTVIEKNSLDIPGVFAGPIRNPANCHDYYLTEPGTWIETQFAAASLGGDLVTINNADENEWIRTNLANYNGVPQLVWIGLSDRNSEGNYEWQDGAPFGYANWAAGEPNDLGNEDYVMMVDPATGQWNDAHSGETLRAVVEIAARHCPCACPLGDMNCDDAVNTGDIPLFVQALLQSGGFGGCDINLADVNQDAQINGRDVSPFVTALLMP